MKHLSALVFTLVLGASAAQAQTTLHIYRAGENDAGASSGAALAATTVDGGGSTHLTLGGAGSPTYTNSTVVAGSTLAFNFTGANSYSGSVDTSLTTSAHFAMELWFKPSSLSGTQGLLYNGNTGGSGVGIFLEENTVVALAGGRFFSTGSTALTTNTWYHAALVSTGGTLTFYLNGASELSRSANFINPGSGALVIGGNNSGGEYFSGAIDQARIFGFSAGTFDTSMLSYSAIPEPSTYAAICGLLALGLAAYRRRKPSV